MNLKDTKVTRIFDESNYDNIKNDVMDTNNTNKVEVKGERVSTKSSNILRENIEEILANLEYAIKRKLTKKQRKILEHIAVNNYYKKGVTKDKLINDFGFSIDYAEKIIYGLRKNNLIVASGIRKGHKMTYFLSNMQDYIPSEQTKVLNTKERSIQSLNYDENILSILFKELSHSNGVFHNFRLQTKLLDKNDYELLKTDGAGIWHFQSSKNKVKMSEFRLSNFRTLVIQVAPSGTVEIYIGASKNPYDLKSDAGLSEFFVDIGKIETIFQIQMRHSLPLESYYNWHIVRMDYNCDIEGLSVSHISNGTNILQVRYLSHLYQFYTKRIPHKGLILRLEERFSYTKPYKTLKEFLSQIRDIENS